MFNEWIWYRSKWSTHSIIKCFASMICRRVFFVKRKIHTALTNLHHALKCRSGIRPNNWIHEYKHNQSSQVVDWYRNLLVSIFFGAWPIAAGTVFPAWSSSNPMRLIRGASIIKSSNSLRESQDSIISPVKHFQNKDAAFKNTVCIMTSGQDQGKLRESVGLDHKCE